MIISHDHKFIFLKTNKTASTSIEAILCKFCGERDVITPFRTDNENARLGRGPQNYRIEHPLKPERPLWRKLLRRPERYWHPSVGFYEHMPAWRIRDYVGEDVWRGYFKFAFERNPWDRQVSWYLYKTKSKGVRPSFESFLRDRTKAFVGNFDIYSLNGEVCVDFLGRYENLQADFGSVLEKLGLDAPQHFPRTNVADRGDYRNYYSPATRAVVADWYANEIELFGYRF
jgi:hypothetical protein